jgi:hypothetical protein
MKIGGQQVGWSKSRSPDSRIQNGEEEVKVGGGGGCVNECGWIGWAIFLFSAPVGRGKPALCDRDQATARTCGALGGS